MGVSSVWVGPGVVKFDQRLVSEEVGPGVVRFDRSVCDQKSRSVIQRMMSAVVALTLALNATYAP
jgi:hypothetical protein